MKRLWVLSKSSIMRVCTIHIPMYTVHISSVFVFAVEVSCSTKLEVFPWHRRVKHCEIGRNTASIMAGAARNHVVNSAFPLTTIDRFETRRKFWLFPRRCQRRTRRLPYVNDFHDHNVLQVSFPCQEIHRNLDMCIFCCIDISVCYSA